MKVAIVHYWLTGIRGGEKMLQSLLEMFPDADIYTHVYKPRAVEGLVKNHRVYTSFINKLPFASKLYPLYLPLMPSALNGFDMQSYDLVISSEAGPAKGVVPAPDAYHICYCHSPMRYIWDMYHLYKKEMPLIVRCCMAIFLQQLRNWDSSSANLVDRFVTNSHYSALRIKRYYNRDADVVFGPADIEPYINTPRSVADYYLYFGHVTYNKKVAVAIEACLALGRKIVVAGAISDTSCLREYRRESLVTFTGRLDAAQTTKMFASARALLFPGIEDMGLVPIEAQAAGCPVIAYRKGGVLDTIAEGVTGLFFDEQTPQSLAAAMRDFETREATFHDRARFTAHVRQFSKSAFIERMQKIIDEGTGVVRWV